jgi:signal transduction histidine kinase
MGCRVHEEIRVLRVAEDPRDVRIAVGGWGPCNDVTINGIDDSHAWLIIMDGAGGIVTADTLGGTFQSVRFARRCRAEQIVAGTYFAISGSGDAEWAHYGVYRLDAQGCIDRFAPLGGRVLHRPELARLNKDGSVDLVINRADEATLMLFSEDLSRSASYTFDSPLANAQALDVVGDPLDEFLLGTDDGRLYLLDARLRPIAALDTKRLGEPRAHLVDRKEGRARFLVNCGDELLLAGLELEDSRNLLGLVIGTIAAIGGLVVVAHSWRRLRGRWPASKSGDAGLSVALRTLTVFGHGEPGKVLARAAMLLGSANRQRIAQEQWRQAVGHALESFHHEVPEALRSVWQHLEPVRFRDLNWRPVQALATDAIGRIETLHSQVTVGHFPHPEEIRESSERLRDLDRRILEIRQDLRALFRCELEEIAHDVVLALKNDLGEAPVSLSVTADGNGAFWARIDPERLRREILEELITNAVTAQTCTTQAWVEVRVRRHDDQILLDVEDGGPGVSEELVSRMFQRGVSTRSQGGGFGLYQARRTLDEFGGWIHHRRGSRGGALSGVGCR